MCACVCGNHGAGYWSFEKPTWYFGLHLPHPSFHAGTSREFTRPNQAVYMRLGSPITAEVLLRRPRTLLNGGFRLTLTILKIWGLVEEASTPRIWDLRRINKNRSALSTSVCARFFQGKDCPGLRAAANWGCSSSNFNFVFHGRRTEVFKARGISSSGKQHTSPSARNTEIP